MKMKRSIIIYLLSLIVMMVSVCGTIFADTVEEEHVHTWETITKKATFDQAGYIRTHCNCGEIQLEERIPGVYFVDVENDYSYYNGNAVYPNVRLKLDDFSYLSEELYDVELLSDFTNAGVHKYKITLKGLQYEGKSTEEFIILKGGITGIKTKTKQVVYNGKKHTIYPIEGIPEGAKVYYSLKSGSIEDPEFKKTLSTEVPYFKDAGEYMVNFYIEHKNYEYYWGYTWLTIEPYTGPLTFKYSFTKTPYNGKKQAPTLTVKDKYGNSHKAKLKEISNGNGIKTGRYEAHYDLGDNYSYGAVKTYYIVPKKPASFKAELRTVYEGYKSVKLTWKKCIGASGYRIYYKKSSAEKYSSFAFGTENTTIKIPSRFLSAGTKYTFKIIPYVEADGRSHYLESQTDTTSITTLKKVAKPTVKRTNSKKVKITWTNIAGETGYQISKSKTKNGKKVYKTYKTNDAKKISKTLTIKKTGTTYYYRVRAYKTIKVGDTYKKVYAPWSDPVKCK